MPLTGQPNSMESVALTPVVANGIVYVGTDENRTVALDEFTGKLIWEFSTGSFVRTPPTVADGKVFFGSWDGYLYALNANDGKLIWKFGPVDLDKGLASGVWTMGVIVTQGRVIFGAQDIYAIDENSGTLVWKTILSEELAHSFGLALGDNMVVASSLDGNVYALDVATGNKLWAFKTNSYIEAVPSIAYGNVYVGSTDNYTYALNAKTGQLVWKTEHGWSDYWTFGGGGWSHAGLADNMVFTSSPDGNRYVFNANTGELIWKFQTGNVSWSGTPIVGDIAYFGSWDGKIYAANKLTGTKLWEYQTNGYLNGDPAIVDGMLIWGSSNDGYLYAIGEPVKPAQGIAIEYAYAAAAIVVVVIIVAAAVVLKKKKVTPEQKT